MTSPDQYGTSATPAKISSRMKDLTGLKFGRLTVLSYFGSDARKKALWRCSCSCTSGKITVLAGSTLSSKNTRSCGCLKSDTTSIRATHHGQAKLGKYTGAYKSWRWMMTRATNPNTNAWDRYGGRGVGVCQRWYRFENFYADMLDRPDGMTLDRTDNGKGYGPGNCRWATPATQASNKRIYKNNKTGCRGISESKHGYYIVELSVDSVRRYLGTFPVTKDGFEAAKAARRLAELLS